MPKVSKIERAIRLMENDAREGTPVITPKRLHEIAEKLKCSYATADTARSRYKARMKEQREMEQWEKEQRPEKDRMKSAWVAERREMEGEQPELPLFAHTDTNPVELPKYTEAMVRRLEAITGRLRKGTSPTDIGPELVDLGEIMEHRV